MLCCDTWFKPTYWSTQEECSKRKLCRLFFSFRGGRHSSFCGAFKLHHQRMLLLDISTNAKITSNAYVLSNFSFQYHSIHHNTFKSGQINCMMKVCLWLSNKKDLVKIREKLWLVNKKANKNSRKSNYISSTTALFSALFHVRSHYSLNWN